MIVSQDYQYHPQEKHQVPCPVGFGSPISSTNIGSEASVKSVEVEPSEILNFTSCLAQLPDPGVTAIKICKIVGTAPTAAWDILPLTIKDVAKATRGDRIFGKLLIAIRAGEISKTDPDLKPFISLFHELYIEQDVIFYGSRIVIPTAQHHDFYKSSI